MEGPFPVLGIHRYQSTRYVSIAFKCGFSDCFDQCLKFDGRYPDQFLASPSDRSHSPAAFVSLIDFAGRWLDSALASVPCFLQLPALCIADAPWHRSGSDRVPPKTVILTRFLTTIFGLSPFPYPRVLRVSTRVGLGTQCVRFINSRRSFMLGKQRG